MSRATRAVLSNIWQPGSCNPVTYILFYQGLKQCFEFSSFLNYTLLLMLTVTFMCYCFFLLLFSEHILRSVQTLPGCDRPQHALCHRGTPLTLLKCQFFAPFCFVCAFKQSFLSLLISKKKQTFSLLQK